MSLGEQRCHPGRGLTSHSLTLHMDKKVLQLGMMTRKYITINCSHAVANVDDQRCEELTLRITKFVGNGLQ